MSKEIFLTAFFITTIVFAVFDVIDNRSALSRAELNAVALAMSHSVSNLTFYVDTNATCRAMMNTDYDGIAVQRGYR